MNQMYEEVNISYQREKRNRENIEEEYKRIQHIIKTNEENKIQLFTNYENMKKEIQLYQDLNRSNEVSYTFTFFPNYFIIIFFK